MSFAKLILVSALVAVMAVSCSAGFLDYIFPTIMTDYYSQVPTKEGYRFNLQDPKGSKREEIGVVMNAGQPDEHLVVMGTIYTYDERTETDTITMYTADKDGYKTRFIIKKRKNRLSPGALKSTAG